LKTRTLSIEDFLSFGSQIAEALGEAHARRIMHKDIKPHNIVINPQTGAVKLIDFGIATRLPRENASVTAVSKIEGTLAYMSPEQTGRMNRAVDFRADLYSAGATFYEMLVGRPPFQSSDPMELVHAHIAKTPEPPVQIAPERAIPVVVSNIVLRLLAKTAEERYRNAFGLKADLDECIRRLRASGRVDDFALGQNDFSDSLQITQKLYGREREMEQLIQAFDRASGGETSIVFVSGESGVGSRPFCTRFTAPLCAVMVTSLPVSSISSNAIFHIMLSFRQCRISRSKYSRRKQSTLCAGGRI